MAPASSVSRRIDSLAIRQEDVSHGALIHEQEVRFSALRPLYLRLVDIFVRGSSAGFTYVKSTGP